MFTALSLSSFQTDELICDSSRWEACVLQIRRPIQSCKYFYIWYYTTLVIIMSCKKKMLLHNMLSKYLIIFVNFVFVSIWKQIQPSCHNISSVTHQRSPCPTKAQINIGLMKLQRINTEKHCEIRYVNVIV